MTPGGLIDALREAGPRVFIPGSSGEPHGLAEALYAAGDALAGLELTTTFVPGINRLEVDRLDPSVVVSGLFMQPGLAQAQRQGRFRHLPMSYGAFQNEMETCAPFDAAIVQLSPPDDDGRCSLGPAAEFTPAVAARARRIIGVINPRVPALKHAPGIARDALAACFETDGGLATYDPGPPDAAAQSIAEHVAALIPDGAALQMGLGKTPAALAARLKTRRGLRLHSGLFSDGALDLADAGALDPDWAHRTCVIAGTETVYQRAKACDLLHVVGCGQTHAPSVLAGLEGLIAVNSALEVDLFGQCNLEIAGGRAVSGPGGAPDFARAARMSRGGLSIIALPAGNAERSRIAPVLSGGMASLARTEIDIVVTEHGVADLRGRSVHERAERLIAVAHPSVRRDLADHWRSVAAKL